MWFTTFPFGSRLYCTWTSGSGTASYNFQSIKIIIGGSLSNLLKEPSTFQSATLFCESTTLLFQSATLFCESTTLFFMNTCRGKIKLFPKLLPGPLNGYYGQNKVVPKSHIFLLFATICSRRLA